MIITWSRDTIFFFRFWCVLALRLLVISHDLHQQSLPGSNRNVDFQICIVMVHCQGFMCMWVQTEISQQLLHGLPWKFSWHILVLCRHYSPFSVFTLHSTNFQSICVCRLYRQPSFLSCEILLNNNIKFFKSFHNIDGCKLQHDRFREASDMVTGYPVFQSDHNFNLISSLVSDWIHPQINSILTSLSC